MLVIKDLPDLKKYLETRREMVQKQKGVTDKKMAPVASMTVMWVRGAVFAFDEAIKAVEALMTRNHDEEG